MKQVRFKTVYQKRHADIIDGSNQEDSYASKIKVSTERRFFLYLLSGFITVGDAQ